MFFLNHPDHLKNDRDDLLLIQFVILHYICSTIQNKWEFLKDMWAFVYGTGSW